MLIIQVMFIKKYNFHIPNRGKMMGSVVLWTGLKADAGQILHCFAVGLAPPSNFEKVG